jgi:hypothetical protein
MSMGIGLMAVCIGCVGRPYQFASVELDPDRYEELGYAEIDAGGLMILNVIPARQNDKIERAIEAAIASKGGDELIDITVQERWFWAWVLNGYRVNIKGMVVKRRAEAPGGE